MFVQIDYLIFRWLNNLAGTNNLLDFFGVFCAEILLPIMFFLLIPINFQRERLPGEHWYEMPLKASLAALLAYFFRYLLGWLFFRLRPFVSLENVHLLVAGNPLESSFPSGHASLAFALAFYLWFYNRSWSLVYFFLALLVGLGRIFVGVHFPFDVLAAIFVGLVGARLIILFETLEGKKVERKISGEKS